MKEINIYEAKTNLSKIINDVLEGEEVIIGRAGLPLVKIVPISGKKKNRISGLFKKDIEFSEDIDKPLSDKIIKQFYK
ncbi:MAG: type II toxin-antitoxin system prevent-host-death family antitoxin [Candidatus Acididesulfobacter guangdongensis]|uniref:Antitoxin n=1 Tax=Acididesulfobacter guangdongensis TaxID=2597225 RepID=A0A519BFB2_ACIG2|nr:MAG: type II toxin-antitoxin system prevent-host-death family antitoxin [Candidatus Acididesulfobacter guangdongensis]